MPRDLAGADLVKHLGRFGYSVTRQTGSHLRLTSTSYGEHHITIPNHDPLRIGTLAAILDSVSAHHHLTREVLLQQLLE
jgi:predicted RNA binding protein YcfA (HicA-like mRNA interferase family)